MSDLYKIFSGDSKTITIPLAKDGVAFDSLGHILIFTAKAAITDADADAKIQKVSGTGIASAPEEEAIITFVPQDTLELASQSLYCDVQAQNLTTGEVSTVAFFRLRVDRDITRETTTSIDVYTSEPGVPIGPQGDTGPQGPPNILSVGSVTTGAAGSNASVSIGGTSPSQNISFTIPRGDTGAACSLAVGSVSTGSAGSNAAVTITGTAPNQTLNLTIPRGDTGSISSLSVSGTTTGAAGSSAAVSVGGTPANPTLAFTIPKGDTGSISSLSVSSTTTGAAGTSASASVGGTAANPTLAFTIPRGDTGAACSLTIGTVTTGATGSSAAAAITGSAPNQTLNLTIPTGATGAACALTVGIVTTGAVGTSAAATITGSAPNQTLNLTIPTGATGSSGASSLLTGLTSAAGTVAATDTLLSAVGKLDGNDALKAPTASLYPFMAGKLITYTDEEAAIADPLITGGDLYRKTAGGVDYVNADNVPSLDLRFATDKTLTARRGPTPAFTRSSSGTFVNSAGTIVGKTTGTTATATSAKDLTVGSTTSLTVDAASVSGWTLGALVMVMVDTNADDNQPSTLPTTEIWFQGTINSIVGTTLSLTITGKTIATGTATSWTLGYRGPRFDHDPVNIGTCKGLLIEEARTNLLVRSEDFANSSWTKSGGSISSVANTSPNGSSNSELFSEDSANSAHIVFQSFAGTIGTVYTLSVFLKYAGRQQVFLENRSIGGNPYVVFDILNGTVVTTLGALTSTIQAYPNGWYKCSVTGTATAAGGNYLIGGYSAGSQTYNGLNGPAFYIYGAQVESGAFPTSYIPTTTGTVARSADFCSITVSAFNNLYNAPEGTLLVNAEEFRRGISYTPIFRIANSANTEINRYQIGTVGNKTGAASPIEFYVSSNGSLSYSTSSNSATSNFKAALAYSVNNMRGALNGVLATVDYAPSALIIGANTFTINSVGGYISAVRYYKKRLPDAKLQTITV